MNNNKITLSMSGLSSIELFSGCGGLAMGLARAGFHHKLMVERDAHSVRTLAHNKATGIEHVRDWEVESSDVREINWTPYQGIDLVAGGPPCQPFSVGGKAAGNLDKRDMWPEAIRAVRETLPKAFLFENVRGLLRPAFADYVNWISAYLANPLLERKEGETHLKHLNRLKRDKRNALYDVEFIPVNAADYGAAQKRLRVIIVGVRMDLGLPWTFPHGTHTEKRLVLDKWITGDYWRRFDMGQPSEDAIASKEERILRKLESGLLEPDDQPWVTCRDALKGLGEPGLRPDIPNHVFQNGARSYPGHTGSPIDEPSKALKAGVHGVPGGENMLQRGDGSVRYFSIRESARLQGLPDDYEFPGSWTESMRQIGNAVPVPLGEFAGRWIANLITKCDTQREVA